MRDHAFSEDGRKVLAAYEHGPDAPIAAALTAMQRAETAEALIIVEGISDQIAVETLAVRFGRDLASEGLVVLPVGGAQAVAKYLRNFGPTGRDLDLAGLCDVDAVDTFCAELTSARVGMPENAADMAELDFHVCVRDLEDELIRAVGIDGVVAALESQGELGSFHTFTKQPEWRSQDIDKQLHRFLGTRARRTQRYASVLMKMVDLNCAPPPLLAVLASA